VIIYLQPPLDRSALGSLPTSPVATVAPSLNDAHTEYDFEMEDITHDAGTSNFSHSDPRSSPSHVSGVDDSKEYHPIINGKLLFIFQLYRNDSL
jgi:hypothetical protein